MLSRRTREVCRVCLVAGGWTLFLLAWRVALERVGDRALLVTAVVLLVAVVVNAAAAALMLFGRHDRVTVPAVATVPGEDRLGRTLQLGDDATRARVVVVTLDPTAGAKRLHGRRGLRA